MDLQKLIIKCKKNDRNAQTALYSACKKQVMGICLRYSTTQVEAEDNFQEVFIKIFHDIISLKDPQAYWAWMKKLTVRSCIDKKRKRIIVADTDFNDLIMGNNEYEKIFDRLETEEIIQLINQLPEGYKTVFNLYEIEGYSHKEIASLLDISEGTSKSQLSKAKSALNGKLIKQNGNLKYERVSGK